VRAIRLTPIARRARYAILPLALALLAPAVRAVVEEAAGGQPFTAAQAEEGRKIYAESCASCHGANLEGGAGPTLTGAGFIGHWADGKKSAGDLFTVIKGSMPMQAPGSLSDAQYAAVVAHILVHNGYAPGAAPFVATAATAPLTPAAPGTPAVAANEHRAFLETPANPGKATTTLPDDAELLKPADTAWLMYNKQYDGTRYSALDQINAGNAAKLVAKCIFQTGESGSFQPSPVVYDGMLYITTAYSTFAINPVSCEKIWSHVYKDQSPTVVTQSRGVAIYRGKLFRVTPNGHFIALDAKTGALLWDVLMADTRVGYWLSAAPIAYDGRVFIGEAGADWGANGHIYAFDSETGRRLWTFDSIPTGKQKGAETWQKGSEHGGGSFWSTFALDPKTGLLYASIGNPAPDYDGAMRPGDNLFTNSVVALDYRTGRLGWYAQQAPHDIHDWDTAAAPVLYEQDGRSYMAVANKGGWAFLYDRNTHKLIAKTEVSPHENVDVPLTPEGVHHCPGIVGGVQWNGTAYSPREKLLYVNSVHWCGTTRLTETRYIAGSSYTGAKHVWDPVAQARGFTHAIDAATGRIVWKRELPTPMVAALTPTAGGIVLTGSLDGYFLVLDAKTGTTLYRFNTGGAVAGAASTYLAGGRQYIALTTGNASRTTWKTTGAGTVVIFGLPEQ
jgi:alcohol dehydrogenase (cytochrome c)